jgi:hypothetical protein
MLHKNNGQQRSPSSNIQSLRQLRHYLWWNLTLDEIADIFRNSLRVGGYCFLQHKTIISTLVVFFTIGLPKVAVTLTSFIGLHIELLQPLKCTREASQLEHA